MLHPEEIRREANRLMANELKARGFRWMQVQNGWKGCNLACWASFLYQESERGLSIEQFSARHVLPAVTAIAQRIDNACDATKPLYLCPWAPDGSLVLPDTEKGSPGIMLATTMSPSVEGESELTLSIGYGQGTPLKAN